MLLIDWDDFIRTEDAVFHMNVVQFCDRVAKYNWTNISLNLVYDFRDGSFNSTYKSRIEILKFVC